MKYTSEVQYDVERRVVYRAMESADMEKGGVGRFMWNCIQKSKDNVAQIDAQTGETEVYSTLLQKCVRAALKMRSMGIGQGDVISLCSHNHFDSVVPVIAAQFLGAVIASTDPSISPIDNQHLMSLAKPKIIFVDGPSEEMMEGVLKAINHTCVMVTFGKGDFMKFEEFVKVVDGEDDFEPEFIEDGNQTACILFSSGTTGLPKGICLNHDQLMFNVANLANWSGAGVILGYATFYWISTTWILLYAMKFGAARLLCSKFNTQTFWENIKHYNVEFVFAAPAQAIMCLEFMPTKWKSSLKYFLMGGTPITPEYLQIIRNKIPYAQVAMAFGQTESGVCLAFTPADVKYMDKLRATGRPMPGYKIKIVDPETEEVLSHNQQGEMRIYAPYLMKGYLNQDSSDCWDEEGYLKTGDIVYYDEDYCFFVTDRLKEMFKYRSWHIVPAKLESILETHPGVQLAAVIGIPHPEDDNHAMAVVVKNKGFRVTEQELANFVNEQVDEKHQLFAGVKFIDSMPLTTTGKLKRRALRDMAVEGKF